MDNALYVELSRQMVLRRHMDIIANNIANSDTTGFKVESLMEKTEPAAPANTAPGLKPVNFVLDNGLARNFNQGSLKRTGGDFDLALEGQGFFTVTTPEGERYTRDGSFTLDPSGQITTSAGDAVMGDGGPIVVDPQRGPVAIAADGTVSQAGAPIGRIRIVTFDNLGALEKTGDNLFRNSSNLQPKPAEARVRQGFLESSNVSPVIEINRMIEVSRSYQRIAEMIDTGAELSRRSIERLGRVN